MNWDAISAVADVLGVIDDFEGLAPQEQAHFHSIVVDLSFYLELVRYMEMAGLIDRSALDVNQRFLLAVLRTPGGRQWWRMAKRTRPMPQSAIDYLQSALDAADTDDIPPITELQPWFAAER